MKHILLLVQTIARAWLYTREIYFSFGKRPLKLKADRLHPRDHSTHRQTPWTDNDSSLLFVARGKAKTDRRTDRRTDRPTDGQMDGRYQAHYLTASLSYAVDNELLQKPEHFPDFICTGHVRRMWNEDEWGLNFTHSSEWGWMDTTRILFIPIHTHMFLLFQLAWYNWLNGDEWIGWGYYSSPFIPIWMNGWNLIPILHSSDMPCIHYRPFCPESKSSDSGMLGKANSYRKNPIDAHGHLQAL